MSKCFRDLLMNQSAQPEGRFKYKTISLPPGAFANICPVWQGVSSSCGPSSRGHPFGYRSCLASGSIHVSHATNYRHDDDTQAPHGISRRRRTSRSPCLRPGRGPGGTPTRSSWSWTASRCPLTRGTMFTEWKLRILPTNRMYNIYRRYSSAAILLVCC